MDHPRKLGKTAVVSQQPTIHVDLPAGHVLKNAPLSSDGKPGRLGKNLVSVRVEEDEAPLFG
jgi:hypothetical protein